MPVADWMDFQVGITWIMRRLVLEFLVEVHEACHMCPATLFLAINILDRYCCRRMINKHYYQLAACASLLVAAKFRERKERVPSLDMLSNLCVSLYTVTDFVDQEWDLLDALQWAVDHPDTCTFIETSLAGQHDPIRKHVSTYIAEISLFYRGVADTMPSTLSRSAQALADYIIQRRWPSSPELESFDMQTINNLHSHLATAPKVLFSKYASPKFSRASIIVELFVRETGHAV